MLDAFTDLLDLGGFIDTPVRSLSLGQRMRGDLVAAMLYEPELLYLDEPTVGLDVVAKARIRDFITHLNTETGTTVMLTTHDITDVERLCRRVVIIDSGKVLYDGDLDSLRRTYVPYRELTLTLGGGPVVDWDLPELDLVEVTGTAERTTATVRFNPDHMKTPEAISRVTSRLSITDLAVREPDLEGVIHEIYTAREVHSR
jgi:ABC-2 type transport system ATP-binding protein